jgi:hypothetical protein
LSPSNVIGDELASKIVFVSSDMCEPYLKVIRGESRPIASEGGMPLLKKSRSEDGATISARRIAFQRSCRGSEQQKSQSH